VDLELNEKECKEMSLTFEIKDKNDNQVGSLDAFVIDDVECLENWSYSERIEEDMISICYLLQSCKV
jgi:hypothetical protein